MSSIKEKIIVAMMVVAIISSFGAFVYGYIQNNTQVQKSERFFCAPSTMFNKVLY